MFSEHEQIIFFLKNQRASVGLYFLPILAFVLFGVCLDRNLAIILVFMDPVSRKYEFCTHAKTTRQPCYNLEMGLGLYCYDNIFQYVSELLP